MADAEVALLYKAASSLQRAGDTKSLTLLRSYYLMRCKDITKGYSLPDKHFSSKARCSKCCIEWRKGTDTKTKSLKLSKKQRRRIRAEKANKLKKKQIQRRIELLKSNKIEQICTFCKQTTVTRVPKPENVTPKPTPITSSNSHTNIIRKPQTEINVAKNKVTGNNNKKSQIKNSIKNTKKTEVNVYSNTSEVFSLNNDKNTLNPKKEGQKIIKNNKKKKDKFAGLCQKDKFAGLCQKDKFAGLCQKDKFAGLCQKDKFAGLCQKDKFAGLCQKDKFAGLCQKAVLASAKLKEGKTNNKLNLFLKPSS